jgi:hypothetical protein
MPEPELRPTFLVPADDYARIVEVLDETSLRDAYVGRWPSRNDFGLHLLEETDAPEKLAQLPRWLRNCVKLDGEALVSELEAEGVYVVTPVESGVVVFDGGVVRKK